MGGCVGSTLADLFYRLVGIIRNCRMYNFGMLWILDGTLCTPLFCIGGL